LKLFILCFLIRQCCFYCICWCQFGYSVLFFTCCFFFLLAALCWSNCVWILNKSPKRHLPRGFLLRSIRSAMCIYMFCLYALCMIYDAGQL